MDSAGDTVMFEETNDAFFVDVARTKDHGFVVIIVHSKTTAEVHLLPAAAAAAGWTADPDPAVRGADPAPADEVESGYDGVAGSGGSGRHGTGLTRLRRRQHGVEY